MNQLIFIFGRPKNDTAKVCLHRHTFVLETNHSDTRSYHHKVTSAQDTHPLLNPDVLAGEVHCRSLCLKVSD